MYVLCKSKNILTLVTIGFIVGMYIEYCLWAQVAVLNHKLLYWTVWDRFMQVLYLGRAPRTKETLPDFREKCRVTRHSRVFRGLTGSQRIPREWGVTIFTSIPTCCMVLVSSFLFFFYFDIYSFCITTLQYFVLKDIRT